jgi:carbonic anhydrase
LIIACTSNTHQSKELTDSVAQQITIPKPIKEKVSTKEEQQALTPEMVINRLKEGNRRYLKNDLTARDHSAMVRDAAKGQYPKAVILSCLDSRVTVEDVFDKGIGDVFVTRIAGNIVNDDILGSMEYGCKVSGAKIILVLGHAACGAIKSAIDNVQLGHITTLLAKIKPAIGMSKNFAGNQTSKNYNYVEEVTHQNIRNSINIIRTKSSILNEMEKKGEIKIIGGYYNIETGEVTFL